MGRPTRGRVWLLCSCPPAANPGPVSGRPRAGQCSGKINRAGRESSVSQVRQQVPGTLSSSPMSSELQDRETPGLSSKSHHFRFK